MKCRQTISAVKHAHETTRTLILYGFSGHFSVCPRMESDQCRTRRNDMFSGIDHADSYTSPFNDRHVSILDR